MDKNESIQMFESLQQNNGTNVDRLKLCKKLQYQIFIRKLRMLQRATKSTVIIYKRLDV